MKCSVDYRNLRWNNLNSEQYRHLKLLLFWPLFGLVFFLVERGGLNRTYHVMQCTLDSKIPFCEYFLIPYLFWFVYIIGMLVYSLFFDVETFSRLMKYIIITYSVAVIIFILFPTKQDLRPASFAHPDLLTNMISGLYAFDTNTNVCPSLHVVGALAILFAAWNSSHFHTTGWRAAFLIAAVLICISTVFIKQHSMLDLLAALPICFGVYPIVYHKRSLRRKAKIA